MAAIQARALLDAGKATERDFAEVVARNLRDATSNPNAVVSGDHDVESLLAADYAYAPLRAHDLPPITDGAAAVVLATAERARQLTDHPVYIRGIDHRVEQHQLGMRDLTASPSTAQAAARAGLRRGDVELAELSAPYSPQELVLRQSLGLGDSVAINPSGGCLAANPVMSSGLIRIIEAARRVAAGDVRRAMAHATGGQCLQHNLVCVMEGE
jgi:acetyl-CoA acetyltransferase